MSFLWGCRAAHDDCTTHAPLAPPNLPGQHLMPMEAMIGIFPSNFRGNITKILICLGQEYLDDFNMTERSKNLHIIVQWFRPFHINAIFFFSLIVYGTKCIYNFVRTELVILHCCRTHLYPSWLYNTGLYHIFTHSLYTSTHSNHYERQNSLVTVTYIIK